MHRRIRIRREKLGLSATELAERAGITPSYVSVIESGGRVPSEEVAHRLAQALDDDPDLYLAWAHARDVKDLPGYLQRMTRLWRYRSDPRMRDKLGSGERLDDEDFDEPDAMESTVRFESPMARSSDRMRRRTLRNQVTRLYQGPPPRTDMVPVPVLDDGFDPGDDPMNADGVQGTIPLPEQVLPPDVVGPFAYQPEKGAVERVSDEVAPGSLVVLSTRTGPLDAEHIQAVRYEGRVILSRVLDRGDSMLLLHDSDSSQVEVVELNPGEMISERIAGTVVLVLKFWEGAMERKVEDPLEDLVQLKIAETSMPLMKPGREFDFVARQTTLPYRSSLGRPGRPTKVRVEGEFLVRDCPWTDSYGWRPIQKAEDMDYLDGNPGMKIRFNLMKGDQVRYVLEMTPDQWREALGDYYQGDTWRTNGYIVAITKRRKGEYTEEFQERWGKWVRKSV